MTNIRKRISKFFRPHKGMSKIMVHDNCGGWIAEIEYSCGVQLKCFKCDKRWESYWGMGEQPIYHYEWFPKEEVDKFYDD
jgi:hypothetical protein